MKFTRHVRYAKYETLMIVPTDLPEEKLERLKTRLDKILEQHGGKEIIFQDWGVRKLAYPIQKMRKGHYYYFRFVGPHEVVAPIEQLLRVGDEVMRFMTVKLEDGLKIDQIDIEAERATIYPWGVKPEEETPQQEESSGSQESGSEKKEEENK